MDIHSLKFGKNLAYLKREIVLLIEYIKYYERRLGNALRELIIGKAGQVSNIIY